MFLLPRGAPVFENVAASSLAPPVLLERLRNERLTGYARVTFPTSFAILLFDAGKLVSAIQQQGGRRFTGLEGITSTFEHLATEGGMLDVYRLSPDLAASVQALLHGDVLYQDQELKLIDSKALLAKLKAQQLNGCLRIHAGLRTALIFYKNGNAIGFFHDGSHEIETSINESQRIAALPGAKIDVFASRAQSFASYDLLEMVNVAKVWEVTLGRHQAESERLARAAKEREERERMAVLAALEDDLKEIAAAYVGKLGKSLVEKELGQQGGRTALVEGPRLQAFLAGVERAARLLCGVKQSEQMVATMRAEVAERLRAARERMTP